MEVLIFDHMNECTQETVQAMLPLVSAQRREQALRYKHISGQFCCLKSWLMLRDLMPEGMKELMNEWEYNEYGKPSFHLSPFTSHLYFSISHCKTGIAVAVNNQPIGIDIESIRHADNQLIVRTMNADEQLAIRNDRDFTRLWTQKEAVVKMLGIGIESFEQLQGVLSEYRDTGTPGYRQLQTIEKENYIFSIAYE